MNEFEKFIEAIKKIREKIVGDIEPLQKQVTEFTERISERFRWPEESKKAIKLFQEQVSALSAAVNPLQEQFSALSTKFEMIKPKVYWLEERMRMIRKEEETKKELGRNLIELEKLRPVMEVTVEVAKTKEEKEEAKRMLKNLDEILSRSKELGIKLLAEGKLAEDKEK